MQEREHRRLCSLLDAIMAHFSGDTPEGRAAQRLGIAYGRRGHLTVSESAALGVLTRVRRRELAARRGGTCGQA